MSPYDSQPYVEYEPSDKPDHTGHDKALRRHGNNQSVGIQHDTSGGMIEASHRINHKTYTCLADNILLNPPSTGQLNPPSTGQLNQSTKGLPIKKHFNPTSTGQLLRLYIGQLNESTRGLLVKNHLNRTPTGQINYPAKGSSQQPTATQNLVQGTAPSCHYGAAIHLPVYPQQRLPGILPSMQPQYYNPPQTDQQGNNIQPQPYSAAQFQDHRSTAKVSSGDSEDPVVERPSNGFTVVGTIGTAELLRVKVQVQGKLVATLIDTDPEVIIMQDKVLDSLQEKPYVIKETLMHGPCRDMQMTCRITNSTLFRIDDLLFSHQLYIAPIDCEMLLGHDFLGSSNVILNIGQGYMFINDKTIKLVFGVETPSATPTVNRITIPTSKVVQPNSVMRMNCTVSVQENDFVVQPISETTLLIPRSVCAKAQSPVVCYMNVTDNPVRPQSEFEIAEGHAVTVIESMDDPEEPSVGTCSTSQQGTSSSGTPLQQEYLPDTILASLPRKGCKYCQRAHQCLAQVLCDVDETVPLAKKRRQKPKIIKTVATAMMLFFETPETDSAFEQSVTQTVIPVVPSVIEDCYHTSILDPMEPVENQLIPESDLTAFSTDMELIFTPSTARIEVDSPNYCYVAAIAQEEGITISGFSAEEIEKQQENDPDLKFILPWIKDGSEPLKNDLFLASPAVKSHWINIQMFFMDDNGVLKSQPKTERANTRLVVPSTLRETVMELSQCQIQQNPSSLARTITAMKEHGRGGLVVETPSREWVSSPLTHQCWMVTVLEEW
ncbi:unnamed protein product [Mytilus coruscus]|uniref:Uncharacterized protein n=1 Tax=Mytilus coruscus TaxID=42192 RepID=A0A6J8E1L7_MYTCO|nr:unnamed protein product [Mytilus coruscus]